MTIYICQCPHRLPAKVWTADNEREALNLLDSDPGIDLEVAAADDMRDAYLTRDPLDLFFWINHAEAPQATGARSAYFGSIGIRYDVEALATLTDDDLIAMAFDGRFRWSDEAMEWALDNQEPVEAESLFHALSEASLVLRTRERLEQADV